MRLSDLAPSSLPPRPVGDAEQLGYLVAAVDRLIGDARAQEVAYATPRPATTLADEIVVLQRQVNRLQAALIDRLGAFDAADGAQAMASVSTANWLRHRVGLPAGQAAETVRTARALRRTLPATAQALEKGEVTAHHAQAIVHTVQRVGDAVVADKHQEVTAEIETVMLGVGRSVDGGSLHGFGRRVREVIDPDGSLTDANRQYDRRWLTVAKSIDGMVNVEGLLDPESGATVLTVLGHAATPSGPTDTRSAAQRRADAFVELCRQNLDRGESSRAGTTQPHLLVTTSLEALQNAAGHLPAELAWSDTLPGPAVQRHACDATITRVLVDSHGMPLDVGRTTKVVPPAIRSALIVRDGGCVAHGCSRPIVWTEAHHIVHWVEGGPTALDNLVLLCRAHHRRVHDEGWRLNKDPDGHHILLPPDG